MVFGYFEPDEGYFEAMEQPKDVEEQPEGEGETQKIITSTFHIDVVKQIRHEIWERFRGYARRVEIDKDTGVPIIRWQKVRKPILTKEGAEEIFNILTLFANESIIFARLSPHAIDTLGKACIMNVARKIYEDREKVLTKEARIPLNLEIITQGCGAIVVAIQSRALFGREIELWYGSQEYRDVSDKEVI